MLRRFVVLIGLLALVGSAACQSGGSEPAEKDEAGALETGDAAESVTSETVVFERAGGGEVAKIAIDGGKVTITLGGSTIEGEPKGQKRRYRKGTSLVAEVKADGDKVKLKDDAGKLLWKIKLSADKIKISDNEENANAFEIKRKDDGFKVVRGETEIGKVKRYPEDGRIKVKGADESEKFAGKGGGGAAWAVLLLDEVPEAERMVIAAEIALRGR
jgi:hypothetical protein